MRKTTQDILIKEAISVEGYIEKQNPKSIISTYSKRYFAFSDNGLFLACAKNQEDYNNGNLKWELPLKSVREVRLEKDPRRFDVVVSGRTYKLRASNPDNRKEWFDAITKLIEYAKLEEEKRQAEIMKLGGEVNFEAEESFMIDREEKSKNFLNPINLVTGTVKGVIVKGAIGVTVNTVKRVSAMIKDPIKNDEEFIKAKGFKEYFDKIDPRLLKSRLMTGLLLREKKEAASNEILSSLLVDSGIHDAQAYRWCVLVSSRPIFIENFDPEDEETLSQDLFPPGLEQDVLYLYGEACDDSKPIHQYSMKDIYEVIVKKKAREDNYFRFVLDTGSEKLQFMTPNFIIVDRWIKAIQSSRAIAKEREKTKLPVIKNMMNIFKLYDDAEENGAEEVRKKVLKDFEKFLRDDRLNSDDLDEVFDAMKLIYEEFVRVMNTCLINKDTRLDVLIIFADVYHGYIVKRLREIFDKNAEDFDNRLCYKFIRFIKEYRNQLKIFGDSFCDPRLDTALSMLSDIVGRRILQSNKKEIENMLKKQIASVPDLDARGKVSTYLPLDFMQLLQDILLHLTQARCSEFSQSLLETCAGCIEYLRNGLYLMTKEVDLTNDQLSAIANNVNSIINRQREFLRIADNTTGEDPKIILKYLSSEKITKWFNKIANKALDRLVNMTLEPFNNEWNKKFYLELNLHSILDERLVTVRDIIAVTDQRFAAHIYNHLLERLMSEYLQCFLKNAEKKQFAKVKVNTLIERLTNDIKSITDFFNNLKCFNNGQLERALHPIREFLDFLTGNIVFLRLSVQNMKEEYGASLKWQTIEILLTLRREELSKQDFEELLQDCKGIFFQTEKNSKGNHVYDVFKKVKQEASIEGPEEAKKVEEALIETEAETEENDSDDRMTSFTQISGISSIEGTSKTMDGYLSYKPENSHFFERRFFVIRKNRLFCYTKKASERSLFCFDVSTFTKIDGENETKIKIEMGGSKKPKAFYLRAEDNDLRNQWLLALSNAKIHVEDLNITQFEDINIYGEDDTPICHEIIPIVELNYTAKFPVNEMAKMRAKMAELDNLQVGQTFLNPEGLKRKPEQPQNTSCWVGLKLLFGGKTKTK